MDAEIGPVPSLITPEFPALFRRVGVADYVKKLFSRELGGKSYLEALRIDGKEEGQNIWVLPIYAKKIGQNNATRKNE